MVLVSGCVGGPARNDQPPGVGPQIDSSPEIDAAAGKLVSDHQGEQPGAVANYVLTRFRYDSWLKPLSMTRRASTLFDSGYLAGCADYAVVTTALLRATGIPSRLVLSVNRDWVDARQSHPFLIPRGHVFIEVWIDGAWRLLDVTYLKLYQDYDPADPVLPHGERYCLRVRDLWQAGINSPEKLVAGLNQCADRLPGESGPPRIPVATPL